MAVKRAKRAVKKAVRKRAPVKRVAKRVVKHAAKRTARVVKHAAKARAVKLVKAATPKAAPKGLGVPVGTVSHYFTHIEVGVIELRAPLKQGDRIRIVGASTNFEQTVGSMQIEHRVVTEAGSGDAIGLKVADRVRQGDTVYRV